MIKSKSNDEQLCYSRQKEESSLFLKPSSSSSSSSSSSKRTTPTPKNIVTTATWPEITLLSSSMAINKNHILTILLNFFLQSASIFTLSSSSLLLSSRQSNSHQHNHHRTLLITTMLLLCSFSSLSTPKPRPPAPTTRPNITFQTYACPEAYAKWYCLNGATCFSVRIGESILYNCECANGYMGQRCEFKDLEGSYPGMPSRESKILEAGIAGGVITVSIMRMKSTSMTTPLLRSSSSTDLNSDFSIYPPQPLLYQKKSGYYSTFSQQQQLPFSQPNNNDNNNLTLITTRKTANCQCILPFNGNKHINHHHHHHHQQQQQHNYHLIIDEKKKFGNILLDLEYSTNDR
ncbi:hypothetical protein DERF_007285 [Dermatophagoides farinae]|uniref:EGF-like domain-containing protein n=1 Tax=Dermatophagoides farinae TaxID=6954 RepID=A0A922L4B8_DERFA|nr:hypothetical protein DERF_007285 [Dermatophagoides farinae]